MSIETLHTMNGRLCSCGRIHRFSSRIVTGPGILDQIVPILRDLGASKPFLLSDRNTFAAAGQALCAHLDAAGVPYTSYTFSSDAPEPDEHFVGSAIMHLDHSCDCIVAVGSGVINDIGKILSITARLPYVIAATAPSMDGYASASSSMTRDSLKISLPTRSADVIIGDTDILREAPTKMLQSGLGDMIAKYVSICEWRLSNLITGEYYCEEIADLIRSALKKCTDNAQKLLLRDEEAVRAVFEGLVIGGVAMNYAGLSRPASGVEHYISHILDMRAVSFGTPADFHGIQCAVGTLLALRLYDRLKAYTPDAEKAIAYAGQFDFNAWSETLRSFLGEGAEAMIALEAKEQKYNPTAHKARLAHILSNWDAILRIIDEELPAPAALEQLLTDIGAPKTLSEIGTEDALFPMIFRATKDIRDKYVLSRLYWDLGILEDPAYMM